MSAALISIEAYSYRLVTNLRLSRTCESKVIFLERRTRHVMYPEHGLRRLLYVYHSKVLVDGAHMKRVYVSISNSATHSKKHKSIGDRVRGECLSARRNGPCRRRDLYHLKTIGRSTAISYMALMEAAFIDR